MVSTDSAIKFQDIWADLSIGNLENTPENRNRNEIKRAISGNHVL